MNHITSPKNVTGIERAASVVGGLALLSSGMRTRGLGGIVQIVTGGMALFRGATGHCELKQLLHEKCQPAAENIERYSHMPLDSDVRSPDFERATATLPNNDPVGRQAPVIQPE